MENLEEKTRFIMKKYGISANKSLGQNFLINQEVVDNIVGLELVDIVLLEKCNNLGEQRVERFVLAQLV